jgi:membrane protease YdiL (CAAX protease family)
MAAYRALLIRQAFRVITAALVIAALQLDRRNLGLVTAQVPSSGRDWAALAVTPLVVVVIVVMALQMVVLFRGRRLPGLERLLPLLPRTASERQQWVFASIGAGLSEELWFRSVLPCVLRAVDPHLSITTVVWIQAVVFGVSHLYQRALGVIGTTAAGAYLGVLTVASGSIWLACALHVALDARFALLPARRVEALAASSSSGH